jgi:hypothetical protein
MLLLHRTLSRVLHNSHHVAWDLGSKAIFYREMEALYGAYRGGRASPLPELPLQYSDYAVWQREWLRGAVLDDLVQYWKEQLAGTSGKLELRQENDNAAEGHLREGLTLAEKVGDKEGLAAHNAALGEMARKRERWAEARERFEKALPVARE